MNYYSKLESCIRESVGFNGESEIQKAYRRIQGFGLCKYTEAVICTIVIKKSYRRSKLILNKIQELYGLNRAESQYINSINELLRKVDKNHFNTIIDLIDHVLSSGKAISTSCKILQIIFCGEFNNLTDKSIKKLSKEDTSVVTLMNKMPELGKLRCPICNKYVDIKDFHVSEVKCKECKRENRTVRTKKERNYSTNRRINTKAKRNRAH